MPSLPDSSGDEGVAYPFHDRVAVRSVDAAVGEGRLVEQIPGSMVRNALRRGHRYEGDRIVPVRLSQEEDDYVQTEAARKGVSRSAVIRDAIDAAAGLKPGRAASTYDDLISASGVRDLCHLSVRQWDALRVLGYEPPVAATSSNGGRKFYTKGAVEAWANSPDVMPLLVKLTAGWTPDAPSD
jgi:hypothetical protein